MPNANSGESAVAIFSRHRGSFMTYDRPGRDARSGIEGAYHGGVMFSVADCNVQKFRDPGNLYVIINAF